MERSDVAKAFGIGRASFNGCLKLAIDGFYELQLAFTAAIAINKPAIYKLVERFRSSNHMRVIPGRREAASPESITTGRGLWIPGSPPSVAPWNDQAEHMIGFIESVH